MNGYLDKSNDNMNLSGDAKSIFAQNTILNINDYITFKQYKQADKNELKGADYTFDMLKHADRSIYRSLLNNILMIVLKYLLFTSHIFLILYTLYPFAPGNTYIALIVYTSWKINDNYCILSQIEYKWYEETCLSKTLKPISNKEKYLLSISQSVKLISWLLA